MAAIADIIGYYGWREIVAVFTDDDYGKNGIDTLGDLLDDVDAKIVYKAGFAPSIDIYGIGAVLTQLAKIEARVFVVHMQPKVGQVVFAVANHLKLISLDYVWIATDAIIEYLDSIHAGSDFFESMQGVIGTRSYIPDSDQLQSFIEQRNEVLMTMDRRTNSYELYAYDSIWLFSYAIDRFLGNNNSIEFIPRDSFPAYGGGGSDLSHLKVLKDGHILLQEIFEMNFTGVSGYVKFDKRGDRIGSSFEVVNVIGTGVRVVGYWTNETGCTVNRPNAIMANQRVHATSSSQERNEKLQDVIWPGGSLTKPRGWVIPKNGRPLLIGVPWKTVYQEFVSTSVDINNTTQFHGFCISVFEAALQNLPYVVPYVFKSFGDGSSAPNYDDLVEKIGNKELDAVVGDITITTKRSKVADFTQPYTTSGLVVVVPMKGSSGSSAWAFMRPFPPSMWCIMGAFFLFTGLVIWMLEQKKNRDFNGRKRKQFVTTLWFIFSTLFFSEREKVKSTLGRAVLIIWLFVVLIITSSYTASLSSILTAQQLTPTIKGIAGLTESNAPIGYQAGSFVEEYLLQLGIDKHRLIPLSTLDSYAEALAKGAGSGGVGAIVDELPFVQSFLSSKCGYMIAGQEFTKSGWGFAFPKGSQLAIDISTAILILVESGELQRIHEDWLHKSDCGSADTNEELHLTSFWGLFLIIGVTSLLCLACYCVRMAWRYHHWVTSQPPNSTPPYSFLKSFASFVSEAELPEGSSSRPRKYIVDQTTSSMDKLQAANPPHYDQGEKEAIFAHTISTFRAPFSNVESNKSIKYIDRVDIPPSHDYQQGEVVEEEEPIYSHTISTVRAPSLPKCGSNEGRKYLDRVQISPSHDYQQGEGEAIFSHTTSTVRAPSDSSVESSKGRKCIDRVEISSSHDQESTPKSGLIKTEEETSIHDDWTNTVVRAILSLKEPSSDIK